MDMKLTIQKYPRWLLSPDGARRRERDEERMKLDKRFQNKKLVSCPSSAPSHLWHVVGVYFCLLHEKEPQSILSSHLLLVLSNDPYFVQLLPPFISFFPRLLFSLASHSHHHPTAMQQTNNVIYLIYLHQLINTEGHSHLLYLDKEGVFLIPQFFFYYLEDEGHILMWFNLPEKRLSISRIRRR